MVSKELDNIYIHAIAMKKLIGEVYKQLRCIWEMAASAKLAEGQPKEEADFYQGKIFTMKYFFEYEVPKTKGLIQRLMSDDRLTVDVAKEFIN